MATKLNGRAPYSLRTQNATCDYVMNGCNPLIGGQHLQIRCLKHEEQFSEYCILINLILGQMCLTRCQDQDRFKIAAALIVLMPAHYLDENGNMDLKQ